MNDENSIRSDTESKAKIRVSDIEIDWDTKKGICRFENLPVAMMWLDTTLAGLMSGLQTMVGSKRFNLALQSEGRKSVESDWNVISKYSNFKNGFKAIANIAAIAGWGSWNLVSYNKKQKKCLFKVANNWEGQYQKALGVCWGSGMLAGKLSGYCSKLFGTNCWAEQTKFIAQGDDFDEFIVKPSILTIESEIEKLLVADKATSADMAVALQKLRTENLERIRVENDLRESEERFRNLLEYIPGVSIQGYATNGIVRYWNKASEEVYGYTAEEAIEKDLAELIIPKDLRLDFKQGLKIGSTAKKSGEIMPPGEVMLKHKKGHLVPVYSIHTVVCIKKKPPIMFCIDVDLSERKKVEMLLKEREEKLRSIVEHASDLFYVHDTNHKLNYVSPKSMEILGYTPKEMMRNWTELITENPINEAGIKFTEVAISTGQQQQVYCLELRKKDGSFVMLEISESPIKDSQGNVKGITGAGRDVTERIKAEHALRDVNEKLEKRVNERTLELTMTNQKLIEEIKDRKAVEESLLKSEKQLKSQTKRLEEMNTALKVLLEHRNQEKIKLEENIMLNVQKLTIPYLDKLLTTRTNGRGKKYIDIIKNNLNDLISPFAGVLSSKSINLSPSEIQISDFIRNGLTNKEIASHLCVSVDTISFHRKNIRRKLGLKYKKINLKSYLQRLTG